MNNLTKRTVVAFKNHQTNKSEFGLIQNLDSINIAEVFCKWVETQHNGLKRMFNFKGVDVWILNVVCDAFPKFENKDEEYCNLCGNLRPHYQWAFRYYPAYC